MKSYKRVASAVLGMAMAASCMAPITAFAAEDFQPPTDNTVIANHPNDETMLHSTPVYRIGTKSFYKVNDDGSVTYADQDTADFKAIPAAYIMGSSASTPPPRATAASWSTSSRFPTARKQTAR